MKYRFAVVGIVMGVMAYLIGSFQESIAKYMESGKEKNFIERTIEKGKDILSESIKFKETPEERTLRFTCMILGFLGSVFTMLSLFKKEDIRMSAISGGVSILAFFWIYIAASIGAFIIMTLIIIAIANEGSIF